MGLKAVREVEETSAICDFAFDSRKVGDPVGHRMPYTMELIRGRILGRLNLMMLYHQRIELNHLCVVVQHRDDELTGNIGGKWCDLGID